MDPLPPHILSIEDEPGVQALMTSDLTRMGFRITCAGTGLEGLELLRTRHFDVVLLDLGLPNMDGYDVLQTMSKDPNLSPIPVIVLTGYAGSETLVQAFDLGAVDFVRKPYVSLELMARINSTLRARQLRDQLRQVNLELDQARQNAEAANRCKSDFLANMSHEIRTPMNGVIAVADLLLDTPLAPEQKELAETIRSSGEALLDIINEILDFSKIEAGRLELERIPFNLRTCLEEALDVIAPKAAAKNLELSYELADGLPSGVIGDSTRIRQVLLNLLGNALKFTAQGEILLTARPASESLVAPVSGGTFDPGTIWIHFVITDTGQGIPRDRLPRLFKAFSQVDASTTRHFGGTGLGLSICKSLVEMMGGRIWVESSVGQGSQFQFILPMAPHAGFSAELPSSEALRDSTILILDDNATNRRVLSLQATRWGMRPKAAASPAEALEWIARGERFDVGVIDLQMPEMDGIGFANTLRTRHPDLATPLILFSSMGVRHDSPDFRSANFSRCLFKPLKPAHLQEALNSILSARKVKATGINPAPHPAAPAASQAPAPQTPAATNAPPQAKPGAPTLAELLPLHILVVDDNPVNQKVACKLLEQLGYKASVANNGHEALKKVMAGGIDLLFMDVQMPVMDGYEAATRIRDWERSRHPAVTQRTPIIAMTANAMKGDREKCIESGMDDYVSKPVVSQALRACLEKWGTQAARNPGPNPVTPRNPTPARSTPASAPTPASPRAGTPSNASAPAPAPAPTPAPGSHHRTQRVCERANVDVQRLELLTHNDPGLLKELTQLYIVQTQENLNRLKSAIDAHETEAIRRIAHASAGASAACGVTAVAEVMKTIEARGREHQLDGVESLWREAEQSFLEAREALCNLAESRA